MKPGDIFTSRLHSSRLKPAGFKKKGRIFMRTTDGYTEKFQIQGSAWNSSEKPWRFYLNCGIHFDDLPPGIATRNVLFAGNHAACRIDHLVAGAPQHYNVTIEDIDPVVELVGSHISACSAYFSHRHQVLRQACIEGRFAGWFLDDPLIRKST